MDKNHVLLQEYQTSVSFESTLAVFDNDDHKWTGIN